MMRHTCVLLLTLTLLIGVSVQPAAGQTTYGIKGGLNLSTQADNPDDALDQKSRPGALGGGFITFKEGSRLSFELDGLVSLRRIAFGAIILDTITYVEVPFVARYPVRKGETLEIRAVGGVVPAFRIRARESVAGDSSDATSAYKKVDLAAVAGAQVEWKKRWLVDARYLFGVTETYAEPASDVTTRQRGLQILVGYRLR